MLFWSFKLVGDFFSSTPEKNCIWTEDAASNSAEKMPYCTLYTKYPMNHHKPADDG